MEINIKSARFWLHPIIMSVVILLAVVSLAAVLYRNVFAANGDPFPASENLAFVAQSDGNGRTGLFKAVQDNSGNTVFVAEGGVINGLTYNAIGFNEYTRYIYGVQNTSSGGRRLIRVGQGGSTYYSDLGLIKNLPTGGNDINQGCFGKGAFSNTLFVRQGDGVGNTALWSVDITPTFSGGQAVATKINLPSTLPNLADFVWIDGYLWGVYGTTRTIYRINPAGGAGSIKSWSIAGIGITAEQYGAQWVYGNGNLGISNNITGKVYQIEIANSTTATPQFKLLSTSNGPASSGNDGTAAIGADVDLSVVKTTSSIYTPGGQIDYQITVTNNSSFAASGFTIDDAFPSVLMNPQTSAAGCSLSGNSLTCIGGTLEPGEPVTINVSAQVPAATTGCINNTAIVIGNDHDPDTTNNSSTAQSCWPAGEVREFTLEKSVSAASVQSGEVVMYSITIRNTGNAPFDGGNLATFSDDLADVLDDATYNNDATNGAVVSGDALSWSGELNVGESKTVTYSVTTADGGDGTMVNNVTTADARGTCAETKNCSVTTDVIPSNTHYLVAKTSDAGSTVNAGETVVYNITIFNDGNTAFTELNPAGFSDDLSDILDDAGYNNDISGGATITNGVIEWSGALDVGETKVITYSVTVNNPSIGDLAMTNVASPFDNGGECANVASCTSEITVQNPNFTVNKTVDKSIANLDEDVTYTLTIENTGAVDYTVASPVSVSDDLTDVMDDASFVSISGGGVFDASSKTIVWSGPLAAGDTATITYVFRVNNLPTGNHTLVNYVSPGSITGDCPTISDCSVSTTVNLPPLTRAFIVSKMSDSDAAKPGDIVTYNIVVKNTGNVSLTSANLAAFTDDMSDVLDNAAYNGDATNGAIVNGNILSWSGELNVGESKTVTYSVTINDSVPSDSFLVNAVSSAATISYGRCNPLGLCLVSTPLFASTPVNPPITPTPPMPIAPLAPNTGFAK